MMLPEAVITAEIICILSPGSYGKNSTTPLQCQIVTSTYENI